RLAAVGVGPVILGAAILVAEDLPGLVQPLHRRVVAGEVGVEAAREHTVGSLDHLDVSARVDLQDPVVVGTPRLHGGDDARSMARPRGARLSCPRWYQRALPC